MEPAWLGLGARSAIHSPNRIEFCNKDLRQAVMLLSVISLYAVRAVEWRRFRKGKD
jgi:hypothetical protein